jgi:hypothetical protein
MNRVAIRRVDPPSAIKFGCVLGALFNFAPSVLCALIARWLIATLRALLEGWQNVEIANLLGQSVRANLTQQLGLEAALKTLRTLDGMAWLVVLLIVLAISLLGGALMSAVTGFSAAIYNVVARVSGGVRVELE